jgi:hypothetical protein
MRFCSKKRKIHPKKKKQRIPTRFVRFVEKAILFHARSFPDSGERRHDPNNLLASAHLSLSAFKGRRFHRFAANGFVCS